MRTSRRINSWTLAVVLILASALLMVAGCGDDQSDADVSAATEQEQIVADFLAALQDKDIDAVFEMVDMASFVGDVPEDQMEAAKDHIAAQMFDYESVEFSGIRMTTEVSDSTALVTLTEGTIKVVNTDGTEETIDIAEADPMEFQLVDDSGEWRLAFLSGI